MAAVGTQSIDLRRSGHACATGFASLLAWGIVSLVMINQKILFASGDDVPRTVLAMMWARDHYFWVDAYYWLPLPFWYYGMWYQALQHVPGFVHWFIPASTIMMALACWGLILLAVEVVRMRERGAGEVSPMSIAVMTIMLVLTIPFAWRMTATTLAEPVFIAILSWLGLMLVRFRREPTARRWVMILVLGLALMFARYEGWPLAFIVWMIACHFAHQGEGPRPRVQWQLLAGFAVLGMLPLTMMWLNATYNGDALLFLKVPKTCAAQLTPKVSEATTWWRVQYSSTLAWAQGCIILPLVIVGLLRGLRRAEMRMYALVVVCVWLSYYQASFSNTFGAAAPDRFCVPALWMSVPIAMLGVAEIVSQRQRWLALLMSLVICAAILSQYQITAVKKWGGGGMFEGSKLATLAERLAWAARERNGYAVVDDYVAMGDTINVFRMYMGVDRVIVEEQWYPKNPPIKGEIYYFTFKGAGGRPSVDRYRGEKLYILDQWPFPGWKKNRKW